MLGRNILTLLSLVLTLILIGGCSAKSHQRDQQVTLDSGADKKEIVVFAASSLTNALTDLEKAYEEEHENVDIILNFAGSKTLRSQLENGAGADLFLSANAGHYEAVKTSGIVKEGSVLLSNSMVLIVSKGSELSGQEGINDIGDLTLDCQIVLAQEGVPAGNYAREIVESYDAGGHPGYYEAVMENVVSEESNVRQVLMKVALGEADAAIVYKTDVIESVKEDLKVVDIPDLYNIEALYYIGLIDEDKPSARAFYDYVLGADGDAVFEKYGFDPVAE